MLSFKEFLGEETKGTLHSFDADETLFNTNAKVHVKHKGKTVQSLSNSEYNNHKLKHGHSYDYSEFKDSKKFADESKPMHKMLNKVKAIHKNIKGSPHHKIIINTARTDMDDKDTYINKFKKHGLPMHDIHVNRAGNDTSKDSVAAKKAKVISQHVEKHGYKNVHVYDDSKENLKHTLALKNKHPNTTFHAWHVQHDGSVQKYKGD